MPARFDGRIWCTVVFTPIGSENPGLRRARIYFEERS
jgi:hypothetical protein